MLAVNTKFPTFSITACVSRNVKNPFCNITQECFPGKWVIYFFWPKDFTPICSTELVAFGSMVEDFDQRDAKVVGGSVDSEFVHLAWCRAVEQPTDTVPFPLLADVRRELTGALGILDRIEGVPQRATFIVDPGQMIRHVSVNDFSVGRNPREILRILDALQMDELCPSNWEKGCPVIDSATAFIERMPILG